MGLLKIDDHRCQRPCVIGRPMDHALMCAGRCTAGRCSE